MPYGPPPDPFWRRLGTRGGFGYWGGWGFAYDPTVDVVVRTNYEAYAEIVLLTPDQAAKEPRAVECRRGDRAYRRRTRRRLSRQT